MGELTFAKMNLKTLRAALAGDGPEHGPIPASFPNRKLISLFRGTNLSTLGVETISRQPEKLQWTRARSALISQNAFINWF